MQLEDYFTVEKLETKHGVVETIRVKGSRIDIAFLVKMFKEGSSAERIRARFPTLSLEQVYATITHYPHSKDAVEDYIRRGDAIGDAFYQEWLANPSPMGEKLKRLKEERSKASGLAS